MRPAVILARVSSPEQEAGYSVEAQLANLQEYAARHDLEVIQVFRIVESSTKGHRPEFERMIEFIGKQKQRTALIVDCVDRLQRSFTHTPVLNALMEKDVLEIHFVREGNVIDKNANSMQKLMWNMGTVMAQSYTDQLTDNVRRSIKLKVEKGEWIAMAPIGYMNATDPATGRGTVVVDPQRASLIQKLFYEYAAGVSSMVELRHKTEEWGLTTRQTNKPISNQLVADILRNPFYCGRMRIKEKEYPHAYPQLINHSIFMACEERRRFPPQQAVKTTRYPFILRGLLTCAVSGRKVTCAKQKGRYIYLITRDPENKDRVIWVKEETVMQQLRTVLQSFAMPEAALAECTDYIKRMHEAEKDMHRASLKELRTEDTNLAEKLNRLMDLRLEGHIDEDLFKAKNKELTLRRRQIASLLDKNIGADSNFKDALSKVLALASKSYDLFEGSKTDEKRGLLGFVFSNLKLEGSTLRYTLRKPFEQFQQLPNNPEWRAARDKSAYWEIAIAVAPIRQAA